MTSQSEPDGIAHEDRIAQLQQEFRNSPPSRTCPVCGKQLIDREKSALELWEAFLEAGPAGEKEWHRRTLGSFIKLANYILILLATAVTLGFGGYAISLMYSLLLATFAWWLSALGVIIVLIFMYDWWKKIRAKEGHNGA
jgi:hypothetical protein